jgi:4-hydroxy-tetrahydrodipicolinate synthase
LSVETKGVIPIVPTPFDEKGALVVDDIARLVDYYETCGAVGVTILGVMGEATKLSWEETLVVVREFLRVARDRLPVVVGASGPSLAGSAELGRIFVAEGGAGVMLQPMPGLKTGGDVVEYFTKFADKTDGAVPICVQDYPQSAGVDISAETWTKLSHIPAVFMLKHEPPAGLQKLSEIREAERSGAARRVSLLTSNNAMHLPEELDRGADGAMVGVAFTDLIVQVCTLHGDGQKDLARDLYEALLPEIRHETQGAFGLAIRKEILRRRGALSAASLRYPGVRLRAGDITELDTLLGRLKKKVSDLGIKTRAAI